MGRDRGRGNITRRERARKKIDIDDIRLFHGLPLTIKVTSIIGWVATGGITFNSLNRSLSTVIQLLLFY